MRKTRLVALFTSVALFAAPAALATVNHGDFLGTSVDFLQVSETTTSADPEPLWDTPLLSGTGDQLLFLPPAFLSGCTSGTADVTSSDLTTTLSAHAGGHISTIAVAENGDVTLLSAPPFGTPATNASAALSGIAKVTETTSGPITAVDIPFSGTFTPSSTFALPGDFGIKTWTGSVFIDVAAVVPLATKVELTITNDLGSNCDVGGTGTIQKKVVSGPVVAIMVNPIECELELDKTCCVPQPVLPDLDNCEGDVTRIVFEYTGDSCKASNNDQGRSFKCWGRREIGGTADITFLKDASILSATPDTDIDKGETVEITSSTGTLPDKLKLKVKGNWYSRQYMKIDTSCDRSLKCGDQFGSLKLAELESTLGGLVDCSAPPPEPQCAPDGDPAGTPCDAKLVDMVLEYNGQDCQDPLGNPQNGEASCVGDATGATNVGVIYGGKFSYKQTVSPSSGINDGDRIRVTATWHGGLFPNQKFFVTNSAGVLQTVEFHVSCSQPLALGDEFGSFKLVEFTTKNGTTVALGDGTNGQLDQCEVPLAPPGQHCTDKLEGLTLVYIGDFLGEGCTVSNPQLGWGTCSGDDDPGDPVSVSTGPGAIIDPVDEIEFGDLVTITADDGGTIPPLVTVTATGPALESQTVQIMTSCWKPLSLGDRFGSFVVFGMDRKDDGPIMLGGNIQYQYKVTNPSGMDTIENVSIDDDQLGNIVSGVTLGPGEMQTFTKSATLFGSTTNVATATGDVAGDMCMPGVDQVDVDVLPPPPGPFHCSEPINELTMIWDGTETVDVFAWEGAPGGNLLAQFDDVPPGSAITVSGMGAEYPTWEIYNASKTVKLGESSFALWCQDYEMNGVTDCGKRQGNLKNNYSYLINDWLLEGMVDSDEELVCTPGPIPSVEACGLGPELLFVLPGLLWLHRRRMRRSE